MEEFMIAQEVPVPVLFISDDGLVTIQALPNNDQPDIGYLPESPCSPKEIAIIENQEDFQKEVLVNIDVQSEVLEDFMEVCISYKCKECAYVSNDQKEFHQHCLKHLLKKRSTKQSAESTTYVYLCSNCSRAFNSAEETKEHMVREHNIKNEKFGCDEVPDMIKTINVSIETEKDTKVKKDLGKKKRKLDEIIQCIDPGGSISNFNYFCKKRNCKYKFRNEKDLEIHEKCHLDSELGNSNKRRLYQCFECNELFNGWHTCCSHLYKAHEIDCDLLKCPVCETYRTSLPLRLENHIRIHSDVRAFTCKHCGKTFKQASQLRNHVIMHADKNGGRKPNWSRSKQCNICFKMYSDSKSLKKHKEEVHSKLRPFVCSVCGHASARKAMLLMHQRQHTGQKPYECQLCSYKTADHNSLRKHTMRHTGVRPYKCPHCEYTAIQSGSYKNHMKIVHPNMEGIYICGVCQFRTISEDNYIRHISDHLTGLIKDNGILEDGKIKEESTKAPDFLSQSLFVDQVAQNENSVDDLNEEYSNQNGNHDDDNIDTGGITIPADPCNDTLHASNT